MKRNSQLAHIEPAFSVASALCVSDTHLFNKYNSALHTQAALIQDSIVEHLFLLGDIFDLEAIHKKLQKTLKEKNKSPHDIPGDFIEMLDFIKFPDKEKHLRYMDNIMAKADTGTTIHYRYGNHDSILGHLKGETLQGIHIDESALATFNGTLTQLVHGHKSDPYCNGDYSNKYVALGCDILDEALKTDHAFKKAFDRITQGKLHYPFPVSNALKILGKSSILEKFRQATLEAAQKQGATAVIAGHIHHPEITAKNTGIYRNTGDGLTHGTALSFNPDEYTAQDGFKILTHRNSSSEIASTYLSGENPHDKKYRIKTLTFLQTTWDIFRENVDMEDIWDHSGKKISTQKNQNKSPFELVA